MAYALIIVKSFECIAHTSENTLANNYGRGYEWTYPISLIYSVLVDFSFLNLDIPSLW